MTIPSVNSELSCPWCSLIVDEVALDGHRNMQIDAALFQTALDHGECIVRIYAWCEPTVSVGYFQSTETALAGPLRDLPVVRRLTGGGAILHDREVTYSLMIPDNHPLHHNPSALYRIAHQQIIQLLGECGCRARLRSDSALQPPQESVAEPFLCFLRQDPNDVVCDVATDRSATSASMKHLPGLQNSDFAQPYKIVGSAQRRRRGTVLQHGSILLQHSERTPEVPGICDLFPDFQLDDFRRELPVRLSACFADTCRRRDYRSSELA